MEHSTVIKYDTLADMRRANRVNGRHFFAPSSMRYFNSKIHDKVFRGNYFVTSEQFIDSHGNAAERLYSVRLMLNHGRIETLPKFQAFEKLSDAVEYINSLPAYLPEAYEYLNDSFRNDNMDKFVDTALIEPVNSRTADYDMTTFCGACSWLCDHYISIDDFVLKRAGKKYVEKLNEHINELKS